MSTSINRQHPHAPTNEEREEKLRRRMERLMARQYLPKNVKALCAACSHWYQTAPKPDTPDDLEHRPKFRPDTPCENCGSRMRYVILPEELMPWRLLRYQNEAVNRDRYGQDYNHYLDKEFKCRHCLVRFARWDTFGCECLLALDSAALDSAKERNHGLLTQCRFCCNQLQVDSKTGLVVKWGDLQHEPSVEEPVEVRLPTYGTYATQTRWYAGQPLRFDGIFPAGVDAPGTVIVDDEIRARAADELTRFMTTRVWRTGQPTEIANDADDRDQDDND